MILISRNVVAVAIALVCLFTSAGFLTKAWRAARQERAEHHFALGQRLEERHQYAAAVEEYRAALSSAHASVRYRLALARALMQLGDWNEADAHLLELRAADPGNGEVNLMLAQIAAARGERAQAEESYHRAIFGYWPQEGVQRRVEARFELVQLLAKYGDRKRVLSELLNLAGDAADDPALKTRIGMMLLRYGSAEHAAEVFREAIDANPGYAEAWLGLGRALMARGEFRRAQAAFRNAVRLAPSSVEARTELAQAEETARLDPSQVNLNAAERYRRSRELLRQVLESLERCGAAVAAEDAARNLLAVPRRREGDTPKALELAQQLWRERPVACRGRDDAVLAAVMTRLEG